MRIHRIQGRNLIEALQRARAAHGEAAVVLSSETQANGRVTVAISDPRPIPVRFPRATPPLLDLPVSKAAPPEPGRAEVRRRLEQSGASVELLQETLEALEQRGASGMHALDAAAEHLGSLVPFAASPRRARGPQAIAFVGPAGVGKTTTAAKLAGKLTRAGTKVAILSLDARRPGASALLEARARALAIPFVLARSLAELERVLPSLQQAELVLIDTAGLSPRESAAHDRSEAQLACLARNMPLAVYLVLAASAAAGALLRGTQTHARPKPLAAVLTKLDETPAPAPALEFLRARGLPLALLCDGQDLERNLERPSADRVADLFLRGRMA